MLLSFRDTGYTMDLKFIPTPWRKVHPEKLAGPQLVKKFSTFYATQVFLTAFTNTQYLSLS